MTPSKLVELVNRAKSLNAQTTVLSIKDAEALSARIEAMERVCKWAVEYIRENHKQETNFSARDWTYDRMCDSVDALSALEPKP